MQRLGCWAISSLATTTTIRTIVDLGGLDTVQALVRPSTADGSSSRGGEQQQQGWAALRKIARDTLRKLIGLAKEDRRLRSYNGSGSSR